LQLAKEFGTYFVKLASMLHDIGEVLSDIPRFAQLYPDNQKLQQSMIDIYQAIFDFCVQARRVFKLGKKNSSTKPSFRAAVALSAALKLLWKPFDVQFGSVKGRISDAVDQITKETDIAEKADKSRAAKER
jgi:hypothetical protein